MVGVGLRPALTEEQLSFICQAIPHSYEGVKSFVMQFAAIDGLQNGAAWFVDVGAVAKAALCDERGNFGEIAIEFFGLGIPESEGFPAGRVSDVTATLKR